MGKPGNILISCISKKVPLIKQVQKAANKIDKDIQVLGGDTNPTCIGSYFVDEFWHMPELKEFALAKLISFCKGHNIRSIIPTRDGELSFFADRRSELSSIGIWVMVSSPKAISLCQDKLRFSQELRAKGYPVIETSQTITDISAQRFVVKEQFGAGSQNIGLNLSLVEAERHAHLLTKPIYQAYVTGVEVSVDLYLDKNGNSKGQVCRTRDTVVNGESQITTTIRDKQLEKMCSSLAEYLKLYGHAVIQIIIDKLGNFNIIECNCRFGGASPLSIAAGLDSFYWFLLEGLGEPLDKYPFIPAEKTMRLIRYAEDLII